VRLKPLYRLFRASNVSSGSNWESLTVSISRPLHPNDRTYSAAMGSSASVHDRKSPGLFESPRRHGPAAAAKAIAAARDGEIKPACFVSQEKRIQCVKIALERNTTTKFPRDHPIPAPKAARKYATNVCHVGVGIVFLFHLGSGTIIPHGLMKHPTFVGGERRWIVLCVRPMVCCCARAASGHAAAPPRSVILSSSTLCFVAYYH
jgi:hypothetical protein